MQNVNNLDKERSIVETRLANLYNFKEHEHNVFNLSETIKDGDYHTRMFSYSENGEDQNGVLQIKFHENSDYPEFCRAFDADGRFFGESKKPLKDYIIPEDRKLIVLVGPSGSGKTTLAGMMESYGAKRVVSSTSRPQRNNEKNGESYNFLSREQFKEYVREGSFIEHAEFNGNLYGQEKTAILDAMFSAPKCAVAIVEIQGWEALSKSYLRNNIQGVFLDLSMDKLVENIRSRASQTHESEGDIQKRISLLESERKNASQFMGDKDIILKDYSLQDMEKWAKSVCQTGPENVKSIAP